MIKNILIVMLFAVSGLTASDKVSLGLHLNEGEQYQMNVQVNVEGKATVPENEMSGDAQVQYGLTLNVLKAHEDGSFDIQSIPNGVELHAKGKFGEEENNYDFSFQEEELKQLQLLAGRKENVSRILPNGKIIAIDGKNIEEYLDQALAALAPDLEKSQIFLNQEKLNELKEQFFVFSMRYPDQPVGVGDQWKHEFDFSGIIAPNSDPKALAIANNIVARNSETFVVTDNKDGLMIVEAHGAPELALDLNEGDLVGTLVFETAKTDKVLTLDATTGLLKSDSTRYELKGKASNEGTIVPFELKVETIVNFEKL